MARSKTELKTFNRGLISPLALARTDLERTTLSAAVMTNWMPRRLGSMMLRPGTKYIGATASNNAAKFIPFVYATDDTALIELTDSLMRVWVDDALITRPSVSTAISGGDFTGGLDAAWIDNDEAGGTAQSEWYIVFDSLKLEGDGENAAIRTQEVTVAAGDQGVEHALEIKINEPDATSSEYRAGPPVTLRVGSTDGADDYITVTELGTGYHSLAFTPTGNFFVQLSNRADTLAFVDYCKVEAAGVMTITAPWAGSDLSSIRYDQSADVIYVACAGCHPYKIERRSATSWSVVKYEVQNGPFRAINTTNITMTPNNLAGLVSIAASTPIFKSSHLGMLLRITSVGQSVTSNIGEDDVYTDPIKVTGVGSSRIFTITITGSWTGTAVLERSLTSDTGPWEAVSGKTWTANTVETFDDSLDNQIAWYRLGFASGWDTGTATFTLDYPLGSIDGIGRFYSITNSSTAIVNVYKDFGNTEASANWYFGEWSEETGYPSSVAFVEGRLAWAGKTKVWISESDAYESFDDTAIGDAGPITRTIGQGSVDNINWMASLTRLLLGTDSAEWAIRSSSEDEPLTPTNCMPKTYSTQGSAAVNPIKYDDAVLFIQQGGTRLLQSTLSETYQLSTSELNLIYPEAGSSPFVRMAIQRKPDPRIHCVRSDGMVALLVHDPTEDVSCWTMQETGDGSDIDAILSTFQAAASSTQTFTTQNVEDVVVLPAKDGEAEDQVYYLVNRLVNGSNVRYLEKWALESECQGGTINKCSDSHVIGTISSGTMTGLTHLEGMEVTVWVNGKDAGRYTVTSGQITGVTESGSNACVGILYPAKFKSTKLGELTEKKNVTRVGVLLNNTHYQGLQYGQDFDNLDDLPLLEDETAIAADTVHGDYDEESFSLNGAWDTDARLCLAACSPRPVTILAAIIETED